MFSLKSFVVATASLAIFPSAYAGILKRNQEPDQPSCVDFTPFTYAGCFRNPGRPAPDTLLFTSTLDKSNMTIEKCVAYCKGNDYRYAGIEYYGKCSCGASVNGYQVAESQCSFKCTGNSSEVCGGDNTLSIYQDPTFPVVDNSIITDYNDIGCYTEGSNGRSLAWRQDQVAEATLTTEKCLTACKLGGFPIAGLEYGRECYCGVVLGNGTVAAPSTDCDLACLGDQTEKCGGRSRLNLFVAHDLESQEPCKDTPSSSSTVVSSTTTSSSSSTTSFETTTTSSSTSETTTTSSSLSSSTSASSTETTSSSSTSSTESSTTSSVPDTSSSASSSSTSTSDTITTSTSSSISSSSSSSTFTSSTVTTSSSSSSSLTTSSSSSSVPPSTSSTSKPPSSTTSSTSKPTTSTISTTSKPISTSSTKTTASLCTKTTTIIPTPTCEYKCGSWCSNPLPPWSDQPGCWQSHSNCAVQIASCFIEAGWPESLKCFEFANWCQSVSSHCNNYCPGNRCSKSSCTSQYPPTGPTLPTPSVSTSVYTCAVSSTKTTSKTTITTSKVTSTSKCVPLPTQTNICTQPHNPYNGYSSTSPVGNIALPCFTCNNAYNEYSSGKCFKLYTSPDSSNCPSYPRGGPSGPSQACKDACDYQYNICMGTYATGCKNRSGPQFTDSYTVASNKCANQRADCYKANANVNPPSSRCGSWNTGWY